jgi:hypothetical protein
VGAELFHADGQIDMTKLIVAFRSFANAPKKSLMSGPFHVDTSSIEQLVRLVSVMSCFVNHLCTIEAFRIFSSNWIYAVVKVCKRLQWSSG